MSSYITLLSPPSPPSPTFFFFNDTAPTEIYTLSLHDALPISGPVFRDACESAVLEAYNAVREQKGMPGEISDRKSTRLNSSHANISYAVFCLKKKKNTKAYDIKAENANPRRMGTQVLRTCIST